MDLRWVSAASSLLLHSPELVGRCWDRPGDRHHPPGSCERRLLTPLFLSATMPAHGLRGAPTSPACRQDCRSRLKKKRRISTSRNWRAHGHVGRYAPRDLLEPILRYAAGRRRMQKTSARRAVSFDHFQTLARTVDDRCSSTGTPRDLPDARAADFGRLTASLVDRNTWPLMRTHPSINIRRAWRRQDKMRLGVASNATAGVIRSDRYAALPEVMKPGFMGALVGEPVE